MKKIVNESLPDLQFRYVEPRPGDVMLTKANIQPFLDLGWKPEVNIEKGIESCFVEFANEKN